MKVPRKWTLWSQKAPPKSGVYWLAGWFPEIPQRLNEPIIWELDQDDLKRDPTCIHSYGPENLLWQGPISFEKGPDVWEVDI